MSSTCWPFFTVHHGQKCPICDDTVRYGIQKYVVSAKEKCREVPDNPQPRLWRHFRVMRLYRDGMDLERISLWLVHSQLKTTLIYAHVDTEHKRKAIEAALGGSIIATLDTAPYTIDDEKLLRRLYGI